MHEVKDHSLAAFTEQLAETRALLGDRLDVYHVHSATLETGVLDDAELHRALAALRDTGVRVGVSTSGPEQAAAVRRALAVAVGGDAAVHLDPGHVERAGDVGGRRWPRRRPTGAR